MSGTERAVFRGGPREYDGKVWTVDAGQPQFWFQPSPTGGPSAVYERTTVIERLSDGPAVRFEYIAADIPSAPLPE